MDVRKELIVNKNDNIHIEKSEKPYKATTK
jgi:hypothetical protein